jgi:hypothetical protein
MNPTIDPAGRARHDVTMRFEILGEISGIETFATDPAFARSRDCEGFMDAAAGANAKASPVCD